MPQISSSGSWMPASRRTSLDENAIHAFREGNGRAQLTFFALLADRAGHPLHIERLDPEVMLDAMIASFDGDESQLSKAIARLID